MNSNSSDFDVFMFGWLCGMITAVIIAVWVYSGETTIESKKIIIPEKKLTTDGKTVDTLYIYKQ